MSTNATPNRNIENERLGYPSMLATQADYKHAPVGTIVEIDGMLAERRVNGWLLSDDEPVELGSRHMPSVGTGEVVQWGSDEGFELESELSELDVRWGSWE